MYDVITLGSATVDAFAKTEKSDLISIQTQNPSDKEQFLAYPIGTKILIDDLEFTTGGGGTNTAVALSKLGLKTAFCGKIGNDENGESIIESLKKAKIQYIGKRTKNNGNMTGYSIILDSIAHDRTILTYKGCNNDFKFGELDKKNLKTKWFYLCSMVGKSFKEMEKLTVFAKKNKIKVMFNPSSYLAERGIEYLSTILKNTDILVLNREEAQDLVGKHELKILVKLLKDLIGSSIVIITDGKSGVFVNDGKYIYMGHSNPIKVIETTGAGDAFGSTFLGAYIKFNNVEKAIKYAVTNAESVITHHGAKNRLLSINQIQSDLRKRPVKIKKVKL